MQGAFGNLKEAAARPGPGTYNAAPSAVGPTGGAFGHATLGTYDYGDPTIRYLPSDGYYCKRDPLSPDEHASAGGSLWL